MEHFLYYVTEKCHKYSICFRLVPEKRVVYKNIYCNGYFDHFLKELVVATDKDKKEWMFIIVHEFSHMLQWINNTTQWTEQIEGEKYIFDYLAEWIDMKIELSPSKLFDIISKCREVERTAEIIAIDLIEKFQLPIDINIYAQKANSYLFFYTIIPHIRCWYKIAPYEIEKVWSLMPVKILSKEFYTVPGLDYICNIIVFI